VNSHYSKNIDNGVSISAGILFPLILEPLERDSGETNGAEGLLVPLFAALVLVLPSLSPPPLLAGAIVGPALGEFEGSVVGVAIGGFDGDVV